MKSFWLIKFQELYIAKDGGFTNIAIMAQRYDSEAEAQEAASTLSFKDKSKLEFIQKQFKVE